MTTAIDALVEEPESFTLHLSNAHNASVTTGTASGTIFDVDTAPPAVSLTSPAPVREGDVVEFTVTLSAPSGGDTELYFETRDGEAIAHYDYTETCCTIVLPAGTTTYTVSVRTIDDPELARTETFTVYVTDGGSDTSVTGTATIVDNDALAPEIRWASLADPPSATISEGDSLEVAGKVWIPGYTDDGSGPPSGIIAQVGYAQGGDPLRDPGWQWQSGRYGFTEGGDYVYFASFTPSGPGMFTYVYRFSTDAGETWFYADLGGPIGGGAGGIPTQPGVVDVLCGDRLGARRSPSGAELWREGDTLALPAAFLDERGRRPGSGQSTRHFSVAGLPDRDSQLAIDDLEA